MSKDPMLVASETEGKIRRNERPANIIHDFLDSGTPESNFVANLFITYKNVILLMTSPQGRKWIYRWLDDTLNYLEQIAKESR